MLSKRQLLIVEDNVLNREMLVEIFEDRYTIWQAGDGQEALDILKERGNEIALILLDVMMPTMDGYTFLDIKNKNAELAPIPVIVMTQGNSLEDEVAALEHGATDFVPKPYHPQVIRHRVASLIKLRETAAMVNQFQYDRLTGLYSKEFFYQKVREQLAENPEQEYAIVCSNIENFKLYNDIFGTEAGDRLLKETADIFRNMAGDASFCGRFGADRFLCMRKQDADHRGYPEFARIKADNFRISKSIIMKWGIYEITDRTVPVERMCDRALLAVESIKGQNQQHFAVYDDALRGKLLREKAITDAMENALKEKQFTVYFQPKYSFSDECMIGAEALVRWNHPEWGFTSPGEFIPLFEKNGFISRLDQYVWEQVCSLLRGWKEKGYPLLPISVNVSRADIYQLHLENILPELIRKYGIDPAYLHLEITESAYAGDSGQIVRMVEKLRRLGFVIEMDDFGSGYSSLNMFSQMKVDILKLDMTFIRNEILKPESQSILKDVIHMAHRMRLSVVAEGVENWEQVDRLRAMKCDYAQGFFFAGPMPIEEFEEFWRAQHAHPARPTSKTPPPKSTLPGLLVVDENDGYRREVCRTFEGQYQVLEATDAAGALAFIRNADYADICIVLLSMTLPEDGAALFLRLLRQEPAHWDIPVLAVIPNGDMVERFPLARETDDFLCKCHPLFDLDRRIRRLVDLAALRKRELTLREEASRDYLTGLLNRRGLQTAMSSLRTEELPAAVCLFDLDGLKKINDSYGHEMGDRMILAFADLLCRSTRSEDIRCRYGGDEFVVILKHIGNADTAKKKVEGICRAFRGCLADEQIPTYCSGGIALCGEDEKLSDVLIERADRALYAAKRKNKGSCFVWDSRL